MKTLEIQLRIDQIKVYNLDQYCDNESQNNFDNKAIRLLNEHKPSLESVIEKKIKEVLGNEFNLMDFQIKKGSIDIFIVIGTVYYAISHYKDFVDGVNLLISHIETIFSTFFGFQDMPVTINSKLKTYFTKPIQYKVPFYSKTANLRPMMILILYLIVTNIIMLVGYIFLIYGVVIRII